MVIDILRYVMIVCFVVRHLYLGSLHLASEPRDVMVVLYYHDRSKRKTYSCGSGRLSIGMLSTLTSLL